MKNINAIYNIFRDVFISLAQTTLTAEQQKFIDYIIELYAAIENKLGSLPINTPELKSSINEFYLYLNRVINDDKRDAPTLLRITETIQKRIGEINSNAGRDLASLRKSLSGQLTPQQNQASEYLTSLILFFEKAADKIAEFQRDMREKETPAAKEFPTGSFAGNVMQYIKRTWDDLSQFIYMQELSDEGPSDPLYPIQKKLLQVYVHMDAIVRSRSTIQNEATNLQTSISSLIWGIRALLPKVSGSNKELLQNLNDYWNENLKQLNELIGTGKVSNQRKGFRSGERVKVKLYEEGHGTYTNIYGRPVQVKDGEYDAIYVMPGEEYGHHVQVISPEIGKLFISNDEDMRPKN